MKGRSTLIILLSCSLGLLVVAFACLVPGFFVAQPLPVATVTIHPTSDVEIREGQLITKDPISPLQITYPREVQFGQSFTFHVTMKAPSDDIPQGIQDLPPAIRKEVSIEFEITSPDIEIDGSNKNTFFPYKGNNENYDAIWIITPRSSGSAAIAFRVYANYPIGLDRYKVILHSSIIHIQISRPLISAKPEEVFTKLIMSLFGWLGGSYIRGRLVNQKLLSRKEPI